MYTDVQIFNRSSHCSSSSLIDTGCTFCLIDSTFAIETCGVLPENLKTIQVNADKVEIYTTSIDSICFCGQMFRQVQCLVANLRKIYQQYAPDFITGANILKSGAWKFDTKQGILTPCDIKQKSRGTTFRWKNHEDYKDVGMDYIVFEGKVNGKKIRWTFDTGSLHNKLPRGVQAGVREQRKQETASIGKTLSISTVTICKDVAFSIGKKKFILDFIEEDSSTGLLNIEFLQGRPFILNYPKQTLEWL